MKKKLCFILLAGAMITSVFADNSSYIGINGGLGNVDSLKNLDFGLNLNGGYQFNKNFALEADYTYFTQADLWGSTGSTAVAGSTMYFIGAGKGILPINEKFDLYGKLGVGIAYSSLSNSGSGTTSTKFLNGSTSAFTPATLAGGGVDFHINSHLALNLEYINYITSSINGLGNASLSSIGLSYKF